MGVDPFYALRSVLDPCAGDGAILRALRGVSQVHGSDLHPERHPTILAGRKPIDASKPVPIEKLIRALGVSSIVTNPPYGRESFDIVANCVSMLASVPKLSLVAVLLPIQWQAAGTRVPLFRSPRYSGAITCCWRPEWIEGTGGGGKIASCWFLWANPFLGMFAARNVFVAKSEALSALSKVTADE